MKRRLWMTLPIGLIALVLGSVATMAHSAQAPTVVNNLAFTYQGQLKQNNSPVNGTCDFQFGLFAAATAGSQVGITQTIANVAVTNGLFTVSVNSQSEFGPTAFDGSARWLGIQVRCPTGSGTYSPLGARQPLGVAPLAWHADEARTASQLNGQPVSTTIPLANNILKWDGNAWSPASLSAGNSIALSGTNNLTISVVAPLNLNSSQSWTIHSVNTMVGGYGIEADASGTGVQAVGGLEGVRALGPTGLYAWGSNQGIYASGPTAIWANSSAITNTALRIGQGEIKVDGAGIGTNTPVFIWQATANNIGGYNYDATFIDHPVTNGDPNAILIVTHNYSASNPQNPNNHPIGVEYLSGKWAIYNEDGATMTPGLAFNVMVIKP